MAPMDLFASGAVIVPLGIVAIVVIGILAIRGSIKGRQRLEATYAQVCRDHGLAPTDTPLGATDAWLTQFDLLPRGDRDCSAVWGMEGPVDLTLAGDRVPARCAAFEWWWEDKQTSRDANGHTKTTWKRRSVLAALVRLPESYLLPRVRLEDEGLFARLGLGGRGDFQVESEEFNKRYDVRVRDDQTAIRLFDPGFQQQMLDTFAGTAFELAGDLALVVVDGPAAGWTLTGLETRRGGPGGLAGLFSRQGDRIETDPSIVQALPGMRHRAVALLRAMPDGWWRAVAQDGGPSRGPA